MKKPLFNFGNPQRVPKKLKNLNYRQARKKTGLYPFGDADRDGYFNIFDCKPFNPKKHMGVYKERADIKHQVYDSSKGFQTEAEIFKEAEKIMPDHFGVEEGFEGGKHSDRLTKALKKRKKAEEQEGETVVKKIVGVHELDRPGSASEETVFAHHHLKKYLTSTYPEKQFKFDIYNPNVVEVREDKSFVPMKMSRALSMPVSGVKTSVRVPKDVRRKLSKEELESIKSGYSLTPPWQISELPRHFTSGKKIKVEITDRPARVVAKSMWPGFSSCESLDSGMHPSGPFSDVAHRNPIAYFYLGTKVPKKDSPSARIMMRRAYPVKARGRETDLDRTKEFIGVAPSVYGSQDDEELFPYLLQDFLKKKNLFHLPLKTAVSHGGYCDSVAHNISERKTPSVFPFLKGEFYEKLEEVADDDDEDYVWEALENEDDDAIIEALDIGQFGNIPDVFVEEFKKPESIDKPPTYSQATSSLLRMPSERDTFDKPKVIPRSFFHHLLSSQDSSVRQLATERPLQETKWQENAIKEIEKELSSSGITSERKAVLNERLERAKEQLKKYRDVEGKHLHRMSMDPSESVRTAVDWYPKLEQRTIEPMLSEKSLQVRKSLFFNPSLTFRQRKTLPKTYIDRKSEDDYRKEMRIYSEDIPKEVSPRVAREMIHIVPHEDITEFSRHVRSVPALHEIYETYPEQRSYVALNPKTPDALLNQYITDVSVSKNTKRRKEKLMLDLLDNRNLSKSMYTRIYNMYKDNGEILAALLILDASSSVKEKISKKIPKHRELIDIVVHNPTLVKYPYLKDIIPKLEKQDLFAFVRGLSRFYPFSGDNVLIKEVIKRIMREQSLAPEVISRMDGLHKISDEEILKKLGLSSIRKTTFSTFLKYLMHSNNSVTKEKVLKMFG